MAEVAAVPLIVGVIVEAVVAEADTRSEVATHHTEAVVIIEGAETEEDIATMEATEEAEDREVVVGAAVVGPTEKIN